MGTYGTMESLISSSGSVIGILREVPTKRSRRLPSFEIASVVDGATVHVCPPSAACTRLESRST
eukprot:912028-Rhodomonas_salina.1